MRLYHWLSVVTHNYEARYTISNADARTSANHGEHFCFLKEGTATRGQNLWLYLPLLLFLLEIYCGHNKSPPELSGGVLAVCMSLTLFSLPLPQTPLNEVSVFSSMLTTRARGTSSRLPLSHWGKWLSLTRPPPLPSPHLSVNANSLRFFIMWECGRGHVRRNPSSALRARGREAA